MKKTAFSKKFVETFPLRGQKKRHVALYTVTLRVVETRKTTKNDIFLIFFLRHFFVVFLLSKGQLVIFGLEIQKKLKNDNREEKIFELFDHGSRKKHYFS